MTEKVKSPEVIWFEPQDAEKPSRHHFHNSGGKLIKYVRADLAQTVPDDISELIRDAAESHSFTGPDSDYLTDPRTDQAYAESQIILNWLDSLHKPA